MKTIVKEILTMLFIYIIATIISYYFILPLGVIAVIIGVPILKKIFFVTDETHYQIKLLVWTVGNLLILDNEYSFFWQEYSRSFLINEWKSFVVFFHEYITNNDYLFLIIVKGSMYTLGKIKELFLAMSFKIGKNIVDVIQTILIYFIMQIEIIFWTCFGSRIYKKVREIAKIE